MTLNDQILATLREHGSMNLDQLIELIRKTDPDLRAVVVKTTVLDLINSDYVRFDDVWHLYPVPYEEYIAAKREAEGRDLDERALGRFAVAMRTKLSNARAAGRAGWNDKEQCTQEELSSMLREHVEKGDPVDVANLCMFLHQRGEGIL